MPRSGSGDPPRADERGAMREIATLAAAVASRRPDVPVVLSGSMSEALDVFGDVSTRPGEVVLAPVATASTKGSDPDAADPLGELLLELALPIDDPRRALGTGTRTLAELLDRRVEAIMLGHDAAARAVAVPGQGGQPSTVRLAVVPSAAVAPAVGSSRMSSGPSSRKLKPRAARSIWSDANPRSANTPSTTAIPRLASTSGSWSKFA